MQYIQIDNFNGNINIITKDDGSGEVKIFDSLKEAEETLSENCQNGQIVPLGVNIPELMRDVSGIIDHSLFELGEGDDEDTKFAQDVERQVNTIIDGYYPKDI